MKNHTKQHQSKARRSGAEKPGPFYTVKYEYRRLNTAQLQSNQKYQRPVDPKHVREIVENFDPLYLDEILVSFRDGRYYVVDGQNRIAAFKQMNRGRDCTINCKVFRGLTYEQEADLFHHLDSIKKKLRYCDVVRARAESKSDPVIVGIGKILSRYGLAWSFSGAGSNKNSTINANHAIIKSHEYLGPEMFELMIRLLVRTWGGHRDSMAASFIKGLTLFVKLYVHDADEEVFVKKLSAASPVEIKSMARAEVSAPRDDIKYARVFLSRYNFRSTNRLDYRLE